MAPSGQPNRPRSGPPGPLKSLEDQVKEIQKLVADARDALAQVSRGLEALGDRMGEEGQALPKD